MMLFLEHNFKLVVMARIIVILAMGICLALSGFAQKENPKKNMPKEDIKVNREYDEQGNLIRFDSTYTYNWSSDSTLLNQLDKNHFFENRLKFSNDSSFWDNSFFSEFDQMFFSPFDSKSDSVMMRKFGHNQFHSFQFDHDSVMPNLKDFDDLFGFHNLEKPDSSSVKSGKKQLHASQSQMEEMMKMMQRQMQEMKEFQKKFFQE